MDPTAPAPSLFVQPHYDDVPLSCGGTVALLAGQGGASIVTVFAGGLVDEMVGPFAAWKHQRWKLTDIDEVQSVRRAEDAAAAAVLGVPVRWLGLPDAIYRGERYSSDDALFGPLRAEERELAEHLAEELRHLPEWRRGTRVFVPLGIGSHVDHQLVFEAGRHLAAAGVAVYAYEDCPYAIHTPAGLDARLAQVEGCLGSPVAVDIEATLQRRIAAIACYSSQVPVIFRFTDDVAGAVTAFARGRGVAGEAAERFWPVRGTR
jgi:LmbE family N-acetylglucosaminyl deacetylase